MTQIDRITSKKFSAIWLLAICLHLSVVPLFGQAVWEQYNGPFSGEITSFATYGDTLFGGSTMTGVFKSIDHGKTWSHTLPELTFVHSVYVHDNALFIGSDKLYRYDASGLKEVSQLVNGAISHMQTFNGQLFVTTDFGFYQYDPGNHVLIPKNNGLPSTPDRVVYWTRDLAVVDDILFCNAIGFGLYKSTDGEYWDKVDVAGYDYGFRDMTTRGDSLICLANQHVFVSTNKGGSWNDIVKNLSLSSSFERLEAAGDRLAIVVYSEGTFELKDGATEWTKISDREFNTLGHDGQTFLASDQAGLYRWDKQQDDFVLSNSGINTSRVNDIELFNGKLYSATERGVHFTSTDGDDWTVVPELRDIFVHKIVKKDTFLFAGTSEGLYRTSANRKDWYKSENGLPNPPVWDIDVTRDKIYLGTDKGVYVSGNNGHSWSLLPNTKSDVTQMLYVGANDSMLVAANTTGLYRILPDSSNWEAIGYYRDYQMESVNIIDGVIYAGSMNSQINRSTDYGRTWRSSGIDAVAKVDMIKRGDNIYASYSGKIFYSANGGTSWSYFYETGMPFIITTCITEGDSAFYTGTYGKSIWRRPFLSITDIESENYEITDSIIYNVAPGTTLGNFRKNVTLGYGTSLEVENTGSATGRLQNASILQENYKIRVIAEDGKSIRILRVASPETITAVNEETKLALRAYPIPAKDKLFFNNPEMIKSYTVQNSVGHRLSVVQYGDYLDVSILSKGLYILTVQNVNNQKQVLKFFKE